MKELLSSAFPCWSHRVRLNIAVSGFLLLLVSVVYVYNLDIGFWKFPLVSVPIAWLLLEFVPKAWPKNFSRVRMNNFWVLLTAGLGFVFILLQPNRYGVFIGMVSFLISKMFVLSNLRVLNGFIEINSVKRWITVCAIGGSFFLFFIFILLNEVEPLHIFPIFFYVFVDTLILYSAERVVENKIQVIIGLLAVFLQVVFDLVCTFSIFIPIIEDNYTSALVIGYLSYLFTIVYFYMVSHKKKSRSMKEVTNYITSLKED
ncbi:hypothetical protein [Jiulongibacter sp. NS-SX5]|uniref:hypothetical protein n=1 Tax=Jiulongibacter sp. NS-SX5 TaxID=3463854 RepID=UPI004058C288